MGVMHFITVVESVSPVSDKWVHVSVEKFDGVEVVVYQPKQQGGDGELRRAVIYFHGGGWCVGGTSEFKDGWMVVLLYKGHGFR